jgi:hypothetical protein
MHGATTKKSMFRIKKKSFTLTMQPAAFFDTFVLHYCLEAGILHSVRHQNLKFYLKNMSVYIWYTCLWSQVASSFHFLLCPVIAQGHYYTGGLMPMRCWSYNHGRYGFNMLCCTRHSITYSAPIHKPKPVCPDATCIFCHRYRHFQPYAVSNLHD